MACTFGAVPPPTPGSGAISPSLWLLHGHGSSLKMSSMSSASPRTDAACRVTSLLQWLGIFCLVWDTEEEEDVSKEERLMEALLVYFREFKRSGGWSRSPENLIAHVQSKGWSLNFLLCTTL